MNTPTLDNNDYSFILKALDRRSKIIRNSVLMLIYFVVSIGAAVAIIAYNISSNPESPLANAISATIDSNQQKELSKNLHNLYLTNAKNNLKPQPDADKKNGLTATNNDLTSMTQQTLDLALKNNWLSELFPAKSTSEKIAESISRLIISFTVLMFIGFVMRVLLVFIKYYMQLGTDFENQKIAFMLSKGESEGFAKTLTTLREHNISFEKTPTLPQEKLIDKVIELARSVKGESGKN